MKRERTLLPRRAAVSLASLAKFGFFALFLLRLLQSMAASAESTQRQLLAVPAAEQPNASTTNLLASMSKVAMRCILAGFAVCARSLEPVLLASGFHLHLTRGRGESVSGTSTTTAQQRHCIGCIARQINTTFLFSAAPL